MATSREGGRAAEDNPAKASSSWPALPSRKTYLTTLASVAFVSGMTVAAVVTIRKGRRTQLEEMRAAATAARTSTTSVQRAQAALPSDAPLADAATKGPVALFKEMNRAIFDRRRMEGDSDTQSSGDAPSALQRRGAVQLTARGKAPKVSAFDAPASSSAPSVLMRSSTRQKQAVVPPSTSATDEASHTSVLQQLREMKMDDAYGDEGQERVAFGDMPAVLALKALGVATVAVGVGAYLFVELACRVLGVSSMDELVERLTTIRPLSERFTVVGDTIGRSARRTLNGWTGVYEDMDTSTTLTDDELRQAHEMTQEYERQPLPIAEAIAQLEDAVGNGDAAAWMTVLSQQLNAERRLDLQERQRRLDVRAAEKAAQARRV